MKAKRPEVTCDLSLKKWMNLQEAIGYLGFGSQNTFKEWRETGKLTYYKVGGSIVYKRTDLDHFVERWKNPAFDRKFL